MEKIEIKLLAAPKKDIDRLEQIDWKDVYSDSCPLNEKNVVWASEIELPDEAETRCDEYAVAEAAFPGSLDTIEASRQSASTIADAVSGYFQEAARVAAAFGEDCYLFLMAEARRPEKNFTVVYYFQLLPPADLDRKLKPEDFFYPDYLQNYSGKARLAWLYSRLDYEPRKTEQRI